MSKGLSGRVAAKSDLVKSPSKTSVGLNESELRTVSWTRSGVSGSCSCVQPGLVSFPRQTFIPNVC